MESSAQDGESDSMEASKSDADPNGENAEREHSPLYISENVVKKDGNTTAKTDGGIYRYKEYSSSGEAMTAQGISLATDELIFTCTENGIGENYDYEIYSLKAHPDRDLLLANCVGHGSIILSHAPAQRIRDGELEDAQENDFVIRKNGSVISGKCFYELRGL